ncbi:MAG: biosynthetic arginine decarboxylase [Spirochaetes bacterium]|nr:biosynthetic arginine decarboxylase [Spirochaetota bacterium]
MVNGVQKEILDRWNIDKAKELYGINNWSAGYFDINQKGEVILTADTRDGKKEISLIDIISGIKERGFDMPLLLRIENFLDSQLTSIHESFKSAIEKFKYKNQYRGVYPIKVNQQQQIIEEITRFGSKYHHGLEAGSKAELIVALSMIDDKDACIICNGYKDESFIDLGLFAIKLGYKCFFVLEMSNELDLIMNRAKIHKIKPNIGVRIKLTTKAGGLWAESGGDRSLFGLTTAQIIETIDKLKEYKMLNCLKLLHYHIGSQIPNIRDIRLGVAEACRFYAELVQEGAPMGYLDLGGGLAVDYDGSKTNFPSSCNYSLKEYCEDLIEIIISTLEEKEVPHPVLITESGRATVAYYSILLFNVIDINRFDPPKVPDKIPDNSNEMLQNIFEVYKSLNLKNIQECYNDALYYKDELHQLFKIGQITLREKALGENIFWNIMVQIVKSSIKLKQKPIELEGMEDALSDIYYCNFSLFQSLPDSWAINQLFPIMPIHKLNLQPSRQAILADITCDSDGKIKKFIDLHDVRNTLPVHEVDDNEDYYLGVFLVGAYQETLGDLHNLFGDTNVLTIRINDDGTFDFDRELEGDSISDVLSYVEYDIKDLSVRFRQSAEKCVKEGIISGADRRKIMQLFDEVLRGYTYFL